MATINRIKQLLYRGIESLRLREAYLSVGHWSNSESGDIESGDAGVLFQRTMQDKEEFVVTHAQFSLSSGLPAPDNLDFVFIIFDEMGGASLEEIILEGDGNYFTEEEIGANPEQELLRYRNTTGDTQRIGLAVDNGEFNPGTGEVQDTYISFIAHAERSLTTVG